LYSSKVIIIDFFSADMNNILNAKYKSFQREPHRSTPTDGRHEKPDSRCPQLYMSNIAKK
jgi:hypothetical protein